MTYALSLYRSHKKKRFAEPVIESSFYLVSDKALEQLRKRGANIITTDKWNSISNESHDKAFTVANVMSADIVQEVYDYVERAVNEGWSFDTFKKKVEAGDLVDRMKKAGWTGENPSRLNVIFDTNISLAQGKGKYQRLMLNIDSKPFGIYHQLDRKSKNKDHEKWDGKKFRLDDPIWNTIMPPSAFGCACWVQATDDPTGVENGSDYLDNINPNDYPLSPVKTWKPDTDKYVDGLRESLDQILKEANRGYSQKDIDNLNKMVTFPTSLEQVRKLQIVNNYGLTIEETACIYDYSRTAYDEVNKYLREDNDGSEPTIESFKRVLNSALDRMPIHSGTAYRGCTIELNDFKEYLSCLTTGETIEHSYFTSSSKEKSTADKYVGNVLMLINSKGGRDISSISHYGENNTKGEDNETEVLFKAGTKYKVTGVDETKGIIELEEV